MAVARMMARNRRWAPVFDDGHYTGLLALADVATLPPSTWPDRRVRDVARDVEPSSVHDSVAATGARLRAESIDAVAVRDLDGRIVGVVTRRDIADIEGLLDRLAPEEGER